LRSEGKEKGGRRREGRLESTHHPGGDHRRGEREEAVERGG